VLCYTSGSAELKYEILGSTSSGPDVVMLHPTPCHHAFWIPAAEKLVSRHRLVLPDLRGHGRSQAGSGPITIKHLGEDLLRLLDILYIEKAYFVGCSIGGYVLYELWRRAPERVAAFSFCCSKPQPDSPEDGHRRDRWIAEVRAHGAEHFFDAMSETLIGPTARHRDISKVIAVRGMMQDVTPETVIAVQRGLASRPDSLVTACSITVPTLVIAGGEDGSSTPAEMKVLAENVHNGGGRSEFHVIADAGHYAPWEQPRVVGLMLSRFFESVPVPGE
jgi:3-oxoadipate enol-lactonase